MSWSLSETNTQVSIKTYVIKDTMWRILNLSFKNGKSRTFRIDYTWKIFCKKLAYSQSCQGNKQLININKHWWNLILLSNKIWIFMAWEMEGINNKQYMIIKFSTINYSNIINRICVCGKLISICQRKNVFRFSKEPEDIHYRRNKNRYRKLIEFSWLYSQSSFKNSEELYWRRKSYFIPSYSPEFALIENTFHCLTEL